MVVYNSIQDIPAATLWAGGQFQVADANLPQELYNPGDAVAAVNEADVSGTILADQAIRDNDGNVIKIGGTPDYQIWSSSAVEPQEILTLLLLGIVLLLTSGWFWGMIFLIIILLIIANIVATLNAPCAGQVVHENPDGSKVYESCAGEILSIDAEGNVESEADAPIDVFGNLAVAAKYAAIGAAAIGGLYLVGNLVSSFRTGEKFSAPALEKVASAGSQLVSKVV